MSSGRVVRDRPGVTPAYNVGAGASPKEYPMPDPFPEDNHRAIADRCRNEALAVRDMLTPGPPPPTRMSRPIARLVAAIRGLSRDHGRQRRFDPDGVVTSQPAE